MLRKQKQMRKLLYTALLGIAITSCGKPTMDDTFIAPPITTQTPKDDGTTTNTATTTVEQTATATTSTETETVAETSGNRIDFDGGYVIRIAESDPKGNITYNFEVYPDENYKLAAYSIGDSYGYDEGTLQGDIDEFIFAEFITFEYNGRTFEVEASNAQHIDYYKAQWDLAKADMAGTDGGDYDNRFVILQSRNYFFGALAQEDYTIYRTSSFERGTILHEIGHVWSLRNDSPIDLDEWRQLMQDHHVSNYGATALFEYIAEAFAHHFLVKAGDPYHAIPDAVREKLESYGL